MKSGVYQIRNLLSGKLYIGSSFDISKRWLEHRKRLRKRRHENARLQNAWNKYGEESFLFEPLLYCSPDRALVHEQGAIDVLVPFYNIAPVAGSRLGSKWSPESRLKMIGNRNGIGNTATLGQPQSQETKDKKSLAMRGFRHTPESCAKISASQKGRQGRIWTDEQKAKVSASMVGRTFSLEHRANLLAAWVTRRALAKNVV